MIRSLGVTVLVLLVLSGASVYAVPGFVQVVIAAVATFGAVHLLQLQSQAKA